MVIGFTFGAMALGAGLHPALQVRTQLLGGSTHCVLHRRCTLGFMAARSTARLLMPCITPIPLQAARRRRWLSFEGTTVAEFKVGGRPPLPALARGAA